jgi:hypothetical protein
MLNASFAGATAMHLHAITVPPITHALANLSAMLDKAAAHAEELGFDRELLLSQRLIVDMFPLVRQVQIACDFARGVPARLAGVEVLSQPDTQQSIAELKELIRVSSEFAAGIDSAAIDAGEKRLIVLRPGTPNERRFEGLAYLTHYGLPNFYFHLTSAYAILRANGVPLGKKDFLGALPTL